MLNNRTELLTLLAFGFLFQILFYNHGMGLNTVVFSSVLTLFCILHKRLPATLSGKILWIGFYCSTIAVVIGHTFYSLVLYWICFSLLPATIVFQEIRYLHFAPPVVLSAIRGTPRVLTSLFSKRSNKSPLVSWLRFVAIPIIIIIVLLGLYAGSNSYFHQSMMAFFETLADMLETVSFGRILLGILGIGFGAFFLVREINTGIITRHHEANTNLKRVRKINLSLKGLSRLLLRKQQVAIVFFVLINLMALWLNILDIQHIWFNFSWDGGFLRDMVREGTYMLIVSILLSMGIALYYLSSNIVFMKNTRLFHLLISIWLFQNMVMVISVVFRNSYYIQYFGLAYKRIFVYFFLAACIVGLCSILYKSVAQKSSTYLFAVNSVSVYVLCITAACFNWDAIIARYNFDHYKTSFVHYEFLQTLNNASLPYLITDEQKLQTVDEVQTNRFSFSSGKEYKKVNYTESVAKRKGYFKQTWEEYGWLDWNLPEAIAYEKLK